MSKISKNFEILALILLMSALIVTASSGDVKAASTTSVYVYTTFGGTISANGTALTGGSTVSYTTGDTLSLSATASSGFKFLCFEYVASVGTETSTSNPFSLTLSASSCAIEPLFVPTSNATATTTGSGTATVSTMLTAGGDTIPSVPSGKSAGTYSNYTVGTAYTFKSVPGTGFKLLYWLTATVVGTTTVYNEYTATNPTIKIESTSVAIQALFVPTSSSVTVPVINEYSTAVVASLAIALVASALGAYAYTRRAKK